MGQQDTRLGTSWQGMQLAVCRDSIVASVIAQETGTDTNEELKVKYQNLCFLIFFEASLVRYNDRSLNPVRKKRRFFAKIKGEQIQTTDLWAYPPRAFAGLPVDSVYRIP